MSTRLCELRQAYPLGSEWGELESFVETVNVQGVDIHLVGLSVDSKLGDAVTGSAGQLDGDPTDRAYFELLERTSVVEMERAGRRRWVTKDQAGAEREFIHHDDLVPRSSDPMRWRYARSNGVAAGPSWGAACQRAEWELVERDHILRSWYGEGKPVAIEVSSGILPGALLEIYGFEAYLFSVGETDDVAVAGVFGFPIRTGIPLLYGFAARGTTVAARAAAAIECIQRLGFLWGEAIPDGEPDFSPTPSFHQEFFLQPSSLERLRRWLRGGHRVVEWGRHSRIGGTSARRFVDITPSELLGSVFVAKAIGDGELPLVFGDPHASVAARLPEEFRVHPIM